MTATTAYFKYGNYTFPEGCTSLSSLQYRTVRSPRGQREQAITTFNLEGYIVGDQTNTTALQMQDDIDGKIGTMITALTEDYQDFAMYKVDGDSTIHYLVSNAADNLTGNQVMYLNFPRGDKAEFATARSFACQIQATIRSAFSNLVDYHDMLSYSGNAGPAYSWHRLPNGAPYYELDHLLTFQHVVHRGYAVALSAYPSPAPVITSVPNYLAHLTQIVKHHPRKYANFGKFDYYRIDWEYHYVFPTDQSAMNVPLRF